MPQGMHSMSLTSPKHVQAHLDGLWEVPAATSRCVDRQSRLAQVKLGSHRAHSMGLNQSWNMCAHLIWLREIPAAATLASQEVGGQEAEAGAD